MSKNFTNSDIFNSYIEIAQQKGLVSLAEDDWKKSKDALEKNPRADSLTQEKIEKLYNLKPQSQKGMDYKKNIMEVAHPSSVVIAPSYDKLNGLVENNNQRQNILLRIVDKRTNGLLTQHKYARDEMVRALVRVANDMDNRDEENLRSLADECLQILAADKDFFFKKIAFDISEYIASPSTKEFFKGSLRADVALAGLGVLLGGLAPALVGAGGVLTGMAAGGMASAKLGLMLGPLISHLAGSPTTFKSLSENIKIVSEELQNLLKDEDIKGNKDYEAFLKDYLEHLKNLNSESEKAHIAEQNISELDDKIQSSQNIKTSKEIKEVLNSFEKYQDLYKAIDVVIDDIKKFREHHEQIEDVASRTGIFGTKSETLQKIKSFFLPTFKSLSPVQEIYMDEETLLNAIENLKSHSSRTAEIANATKKKISETALEAKNISEEYKQKIENLMKQEEAKKSSSNILTQSPSNDNAEAARKAAMQRLARLIKNS